jgi:RND family efflux transporter MFP subunit
MKTRITLLLSIVLAAAWAGCSHEAKLAQAENTTLRARTAPVSVREVPRLISVEGTIHAEDDAVLSSRAMGPVVRERAKVGDRVKKGDVLLEIEERMNSGMLSQAKGALAQAQAAEALASTNLKRFEVLFSEQACSQLELDMARMQAETAQGAVKQAQGAVDAAGAVANESSVRAPFDGVVVEKFVNVGDLVAPGRPLIRVQTQTGRELQFNVRAADGMQLKQGTPITCKLDDENQSVEATITEIAPSADPMTHTIAVKAQITNDSLAAGYTATAEIPGAMIRATLVPKSAVFATGGLHLVSVVDQNGAARTRAVTIGRERGDEIEILSGLASGETVVLDRSALIAEGTKIERSNG